MISLKFLFTLLICTMFVSQFYGQDLQSPREEWLMHLDRMARPVMYHLANDELKQEMKVELSIRIDNPESRKKVAYLEAFGRTLCGISPWLNLEGGSEAESTLRNQYREWTLQAIANATDPSKKDYMDWEGGQPLVDASFFALALNRCPWIWVNLPEDVKKNVVLALNKSRAVIPVYSNWILFSAMIEAFFCKHDLPYDAVRIEYAIKTFSKHWYTGDGMFSDGMNFSLDYYNSYVIQPYLMNILEAVKERDTRFNYYQPEMNKIAARYAEIQERSIHADGSFPVIGRSIVYRSGAFHHLAAMALKDQLPESISPSQVRGALSAVINKTLGAMHTYNNEKWLNIGLHGHQPNLADFYITTGSLYLASAIFLPLGLPDDHIFWTGKDESWTSLKVWSGQNASPDHSLH